MSVGSNLSMAGEMFPTLEARKQREVEVCTYIGKRDHEKLRAVGTYLLERGEDIDLAYSAFKNLHDRGNLKREFEKIGRLFLGSDPEKAYYAFTDAGCGDGLAEARKRLIRQDAKKAFETFKRFGDNAGIELMAAKGEVVSGGNGNGSGHANYISSRATDSGLIVYSSAEEVAEKFRKPERLVRFESEGAEIIITVTDTILGPAVGGVRWSVYPSAEEAVNECIGLARTMQYKWLALRKIVRAEDRSALFSGGKAVINDPHISDTIKDGEGPVMSRAKDPERIKRLFKQFAKKVDELGGTYYTAPDMNTDTSVMDIIQEETQFVKCIREGTGDPSPVTAEGVYVGMKALGERICSSLDNARIVVQGVGKVGSPLVKRIREEHPDAKIIIAEKDHERGGRLARLYDCNYVPDLDRVNFSDVDIFSPNAKSSVIDRSLVRKLRPNSVIAGGANNQIKEADKTIIYEMFGDRGILYAPDYVINLGGICDVAFGGSRGKSMDIVRRIGGLLLEIQKHSRETGDATAVVADRLCEKHYMEELKKIK